MMLTKMVQTFSIARSGLYFLEALPLTLVSRYLAHPDLPPPSDEQLRAFWRHILRLHEVEARDIERGVYSWRLLEHENPLAHMRSWMEVMGDGVRVAWRMRGHH